MVFILSTMRSGSTLLKSLLAVPEETSHLPEVHFHKYKWLQQFRLKALSEKSIIVLKKPSWVGEKNYPTLPDFLDSKKIILIRHPYETIVSIRKMKKDIDPQNKLDWDDTTLLAYWNETYENLLKSATSTDLIIRYEELVENPIDVTSELFEFIGLSNQEGVDSYKPPTKYSWSWHNDDGGEKIKSLKVSPSPLNRNDSALMTLILGNEKTQGLLNQYGYEIKKNPS